MAHFLKEKKKGLVSNRLALTLCLLTDCLFYAFDSLSRDVSLEYIAKLVVARLYTRIDSLEKILGQIKKICVFRLTGLKILGRVATAHIFFLIIFFLKKNIILCILKF